MPVPPLAHLGHWYVGGPVFLSPVVAIWLLIKLAGWRDRRRGISRHESRVEVSTDGESARIAVRGALDWPALVDLETELEDLRGEASHIELELDGTTEVTRRNAARLAEIVEVAEVGASVSISPGSVANEQVLRAAGALGNAPLLADAAGPAGPAPAAGRS